MKYNVRYIIEKMRLYHLELKHLLIIFIVLAAAQVLITLVQKASLQRFLAETQNSYQRDTAERLASLTATALELLLETLGQTHIHADNVSRKSIEAINIILSQQLLQQNVEDVCVLVSHKNQIIPIDNGRVLYENFMGSLSQIPPPDIPHRDAIKLYRQIRDTLLSTEQIYSIVEGKQTFHVFVPFIPKGEYAGAVYMKNSPDFKFITKEIVSAYNQTGIIFSGLILFGLLAMFFISSNTLNERDEAQRMLYKLREKQLEEKIHLQKEAMFAKRIYHTHHKAEKILGFIKEDLRGLSEENINEVKYRVGKYANFVSRVIYDMKWYEPPIQAIRNPLFKTDLNEVIRFIVDNICLRTTQNTSIYRFELKLDASLPLVHVNEFVVWEIVEPLLQNSMDHSRNRKVTITVETKYDPANNIARILISDDGYGIKRELLQKNENGVKRIFLENISTKQVEENSGYGCYLAYEIAKQWCGWSLDAENISGGGCRFTITIPQVNTHV